MSSNFKLDIVTQHEPEEPGLSTTITSRLSLDGIREQGKMPINNFATNAERRALNDRCEINLLYHSFILKIHFFFLLKYIFCGLSLCIDVFPFLCFQLYSITRNLTNLTTFKYLRSFVLLIFKLYKHGCQRCATSMLTLWFLLSFNHCKLHSSQIPYLCQLFS